MGIVELRNLEDSRQYILQGLWFQRVATPSAARLKTILEWVLEILSHGHALLPSGFIADMGHIALGHDARNESREPVHASIWPAGLLRSYEDQVLGKLYADWTFERASDALRRYQTRDRIRGLSYTVKQLRDRGQIGGVELSPAVVRGLLAAKPEEVLQQGFESLQTSGPMPLLLEQYEHLISAVRRMGDLLGPEDVIALEQQTALAGMGQYVAHRQILQLVGMMESRIPHRPVRPMTGRKEVPTRVLNDDQYPVGGYSSIATRGSIESLLHSQLAYMEPEPPDLFDVKFVRDELFYYSRDENQFRRRRRSFAILLRPECVSARYKDPELPAQRLVLTSAVLLTVLRRLADWLSTDALHFELMFLKDANQKGIPLKEEAALFSILTREWQERKLAEITTRFTADEAEAHCQRVARQVELHVLVVGPEVVPVHIPEAVVTYLALNGPKPHLLLEDGTILPTTGEDAQDHWIGTAIALLQLWV